MRMCVSVGATVYNSMEFQSMVLFISRDGPARYGGRYPNRRAKKRVRRSSLCSRATSTYPTSVFALPLRFGVAPPHSLSKDPTQVAQQQHPRRKGQAQAASATELP